MKNFFVNQGAWTNFNKAGYKGVLDLGKFVREYLQTNAVPSIPECCSNVSAGTPVRFNSTTNQIEYTLDGSTWVTKTSSAGTVDVLSTDTTFTTGTLPLGSKTFYITKGSAAAIVLPNPIVGTQDGLKLTFTATTAFSHTVTYAAGFDNDGSSYDVATFNSSSLKGSITVEAYQGIWYLVSDVNVTIA